MNPPPEKLFQGTVLWASPDLLLAARGTKIFRSLDRGDNWNVVADLKVDALNWAASRQMWLRRLTRRDVHHAVQLDSGRFLVCAYRGFYLLDLSTEVALRLPEKWHGGRPLALCAYKGRPYYGEYRDNRERSPVAVWRSDDEGRTWSQAWKFDGVRHVHGVYHDKYQDAVWVTTGDLDHECGLWCTTDDFRSLERVAGGSQATRIVQPLFTRDAVLFGTDAPMEHNHLYRLDRRTGQITQQMRVDGPVFFGSVIEGACFFSTVVEPGLGHPPPEASVWCSMDQGLTWKRILGFRKDFLSMRWFQYGQVLFPSSQSTSSRLWLTPFATDDHQTSMCYDLSDITREPLS